MDGQGTASRTTTGRTGRFVTPVALGGIAAGLISLGPVTSTNLPLSAPAESQTVAAAKLPGPPANGVMGFVVQDFVPPVIPGMKDACPNGPAPRLRDQYLRTLPRDEQARLRLKTNEKELEDRWHRYAFGPNGTNICSQPDMFDHPAYPLVESKYAWGFDLDGSASGKKDPDTCSHPEFQSPAGEQGIDNQEYRAFGCTLEWRGKDGNGGDMLVGEKQFHNSGEWTQVILLKGVDSLVNDSDVEVIYANTADRPAIDSKGNTLVGQSFTVADKGARHRNVLHGRIVNGVLTTDPTDIRLAETWGQGGARDIRGNRSQYHWIKGRLRLEFQPDGSVRGFVGGYRPIFDTILSTSLGGPGSALDAGIDCAAQLKTLQQQADGVRDPKTGKCTAVSSAWRIAAVPAFVNDLPNLSTRTARK